MKVQSLFRKAKSTYFIYKALKSLLCVPAEGAAAEDNSLTQFLVFCLMSERHVRRRQDVRSEWSVSVLRVTKLDLFHFSSTVHTDIKDCVPRKETQKEKRRKRGGAHAPGAGLCPSAAVTHPVRRAALTAHGVALENHRQLALSRSREQRKRSAGRNPARSASTRTN